MNANTTPTKPSLSRLEFLRLMGIGVGSALSLASGSGRMAEARPASPPADPFRDSVSNSVSDRLFRPPLSQDFPDTIRSTAKSDPATGVGTEINYDGAAGNILAIDRSPSPDVYKTLNLNGNPIKLRANGADSVTIISGGNVGIGTTNPAVLLHLKSTGNTTLTIEGLSVNSQPGIAVLNWINSEPTMQFGFPVGEGAARHFNFRVNGTDRFIIRGSGNVGIGTTSPYTLLHVQKDIAGALGPTLTLMNGSGNPGAGASIDFDGAYRASNQPPSARIQSIDAGNFSSHIVFYTKAGGSSNNPLYECLRVTAAGSIGIATATPAGILQIAGASSEKGLILSTGVIGDTLPIGAQFIPTLIPQFGSATLVGIDCTPVFNIGTTSASVACSLQLSPPTKIGAGTIANAYSLCIQAPTIASSNFSIYVLNGKSYFGENVGVLTATPIFPLDVNGYIHYGTLYASSDERFKKNVQPLVNVLGKLSRIRGVRFEWNELINSERDGYELGKPTLGLIAQEVEQEFPELVVRWKLNDIVPDARAMSYERLIPVLIEAIKELNTRVDVLVKGETS